MENWPPAGIPQPDFQFGSLAMVQQLKSSLQGWDWRNPTNPERTAWFTNARCSRGHTVTGVVLVGPTGTLYPFARCDAPPGEVKHFLVLWPPYEYPEHPPAPESFGDATFGGGTF